MEQPEGRPGLGCGCELGSERHSGHRSGFAPFCTKGSQGTAAPGCPAHHRGPGRSVMASDLHANGSDSGRPSQASVAWGLVTLLRLWSPGTRDGGPHPPSPCHRKPSLGVISYRGNLFVPGSTDLVWEDKPLGGHCLALPSWQWPWASGSLCCQLPRAWAPQRSPPKSTGKVASQLHWTRSHPPGCEE